MFFILSTGRSGTKTIARTLNALPGCYCPHEPVPTLIAEGSAYRHGQVSGEKIRRILRESRSPTFYGATYGESNQKLSFVIPELAETFLEAKFVWLIRNGLDVVASIMARGWYGGYEEDYETMPERWKAWRDHRIQGDLCGDVSKKKWMRMAPFERCCWYWSYVNRLVCHDLKLHAPGRYRVLKLENIHQDLLKTVRWLGLPALAVPAARRHNKAESYQPYHWKQWSQAEREKFETWCCEQMDYFYPTWRKDSGEWVGVDYGKPSNLHHLLSNHPRIIYFINRAYRKSSTILGL